MARSRNILERFRPAGTPGAAAKRGVPADRVAELSAELEPVLAALADSVAEAQRIRAEGQNQAERIRRQVDERARALAAEARRDAEAERLDAAARVAQRAEAEYAEAVLAAERDAAAVRRRGAELLPSYVDRVLATAREALTDPSLGRTEGAGT